MISKQNYYLTYKDEKPYKLASAFLLAQEYGFNRVMSSYFFETHDSERGPPGSQPNPTGECGNGWVCEHRWPAIGNMIQVYHLIQSNS